MPPHLVQPCYEALGRALIIELQALYLSGTYCHKIGTTPPSCDNPRQPTMYMFQGGFNWGFRVNVYLNLIHALAHSATKCGYLALMFYNVFVADFN